jgi:hypothetical protein
MLSDTALQNQPLQNQTGALLFIFLIVVIFVILLKIVRDQHITLKKFQSALGDASYYWIIKTVKAYPTPLYSEEVFDFKVFFLLISLKIKQFFSRVRTIYNDITAQKNSQIF